MPKIKMLEDYFLSPFTDSEDKEFAKHQIRGLRSVMKSVAGRKGYNFRNVRVNLEGIKTSLWPEYYEDVFGIRNYGIDSKGKIRYVDTEILITKLPFKERNKSKVEKEIEAWRNIGKNGGKLEHKLSGIIAIASLGLSIFFLLPTLTGNTIGNLNPTFSNWIGGVLFISGLIGAFLALRKNNLKYSLP